MSHADKKSPEPVRARLLKAALECFLADDYHRATTRNIAERASTNISMIRYYFGSKEGLYEEMILDMYGPLLDALDELKGSSGEDLAALFRFYYARMVERPEFPKLVLKVLALKQGPGRRFIYRILERGRAGTARKVAECKARGQLPPSADPDIVRMTFLSLAMMPMLLKDVFEQQLGRRLDETFLEHLAAFNGRLLRAALVPGAGK